MNQVFEDDYPIKKEEKLMNGLKHKSLRGNDWRDFAIEVSYHIEKYTVPQYGDKGNDQCTEFTIQDFLTQIKKYCNRCGRNSRVGQDKLDMMKIAHYAQMAYDKMEGKD